MISCQFCSKYQIDENFKMSPQCHSVPIKCICEKGKKKSDLSHNNLLDEAKSRSQGNQMNGNDMQNIDIDIEY